MKAPENFEELLLAVLKDKFSDELASGISIESVSVDHDSGEVQIVLNVSTSVKPKQFAEEYFGLAKILRRSLSEKSPSLGKFFPVITPHFAQGAHA